MIHTYCSHLNSNRRVPKKSCRNQSSLKLTSLSYLAALNGTHGFHSSSCSVSLLFEVWEFRCHNSSPGRLLYCSLILSPLLISSDHRKDSKLSTQTTATTKITSVLFLISKEIAQSKTLYKLWRTILIPSMLNQLAVQYRTHHALGRLDLYLSMFC